MEVMSAGLVDPGRFFSPRKLALTSSPLHLSSTLWGKVISEASRLKGRIDSVAQNTMIREDLSLLRLSMTSWESETVSLAVSLVCSLANGLVN